MTRIDKAVVVGVASAMLVAALARADVISRGGLTQVVHDGTMAGNGTNVSPLSAVGVISGLTSGKVPVATSSTAIGNSTGLSEASSVFSIGEVAKGNADDTYLTWDTASADRLGITKKATFAPKFTYGSGTTFAIAESSGATIAASNTFTDRLTIDASGNATIPQTLTVNSGGSSTSAGLTVTGGVVDTFTQGAYINAQNYVGITAPGSYDNIAFNAITQYLPSGAGVNLLGIVAGTGEVAEIYNADTTNSLVIKHNASSTAAYSFYLPGAQDWTLGPRCLARFSHNQASGVNKWALSGWGCNLFPGLIVDGNTTFGSSSSSPHWTDKDTSTRPTLSTCGTSPSVLGDDASGVVTVGTGGASSCVLTFHTAYGSNVSCVVTYRSGALTSYAVTTTTLTATATLGAGSKFDYECRDH